MEITLENKEIMDAIAIYMALKNIKGGSIRYEIGEDMNLRLIISDVEPFNISREKLLSNIDIMIK